MAESTVFYLCPKCFQVCEVPEEDHDHAMVRCDPEALDRDSRMPPVDEHGHLMTRAPRWYLEAIGILPG